MTEERKEVCGTGRATWPVMVSIALNLFLVGVVVGPVLRSGETFHVAAPHGDRLQEGGRPMPPPRNGGVPGFMLDKVARALAPDEAEKFRTIFDEERKGAQDRPADHRKLMQKIAAIMKEEKPDMDALRKVMDEVRTSGQALHDGMSRALERVATEISPEGRRKIASLIEQDRGPDQGPDGPPPPLME